MHSHDLTFLLSAIAIVALIAVNGIFVAAEFAIVRVRRTRLEELAGQGQSDATQAIELVDRVGEYLTTTQLGITMASLGVGWLAEDAIDRGLRLVLPTAANGILHGVAATLAFMLATMLLTVLGEIVPKNLAITNADAFLLRLASPLRVFHRIVRPLSRFFTSVSERIERALGNERQTTQPLSEAELKLVLADSHADGVLTESEAKIILRAFEFADASARDIMVLAEGVDYLSLARSFEENVDVARRTRHARLPLCAEGVDSVLGVVSMKDVWIAAANASNDVFHNACRAAPKVDAELSRDAILRRLQASRAQMAIVRDTADRETLGIVTLEDVLESLLGNVREEKRSPQPGGSVP